MAFTFLNFQSPLPSCLSLLLRNYVLLNLVRKGKFILICWDDHVIGGYKFFVSVYQKARTPYSWFIQYLKNKMESLLIPSLFSNQVQNKDSQNLNIITNKRIRISTIEWALISESLIWLSIYTQGGFGSYYFFKILNNPTWIKKYNNVKCIQWFDQQY